MESEDFFFQFYYVLIKRRAFIISFHLESVHLLCFKRISIRLPFKQKLRKSYVFRSLFSIFDTFLSDLLQSFCNQSSLQTKLTKIGRFSFTVYNFSHFSVRLSGEIKSSVNFILSLSTSNQTYENRVLFVQC